jgi:hypothetical protein
MEGEKDENITGRRKTSCGRKDKARLRSRMKKKMEV